MVSRPLSWSFPVVQRALCTLAGETLLGLDADNNTVWSVALSPGGRIRTASFGATVLFDTIQPRLRTLQSSLSQACRHLVKRN